MEIGSLVAAFLIGVFIAALFGAAGSSAAWRNGVVDGFGFAVEPCNPGYQKAGNMLRRTMNHRWGFLLKHLPSQGPYNLSQELKKMEELVRDKPQANNSSASGPVLWSRADSTSGPGESGAVTGFAPIPGAEQPPG